MKKVLFVFVLIFGISVMFHDEIKSNDISGVSCLAYLKKQMELDTYKNYRPVYVNEHDYNYDNPLNYGNGFLHKEDLLFSRGYQGKMEFDFSRRLVSFYLRSDLPSSDSIKFDDLKTLDLSSVDSTMIYPVYEARRLLDFYYRSLISSGCVESFEEKLSVKKLENRTTSQDVLIHKGSLLLEEWWQIDDVDFQLFDNPKLIELKNWQEAANIRIFDERLRKNSSNQYFGQFYVYFTSREFNVHYYEEKTMYNSTFIWNVDALINNIVVDLFETPIFVVDLSRQENLNTRSSSANYLDLEAIPNSLYLFANPENGKFRHVGSFYSYQDISNEFQKHVRLFYANDYSDYSMKILGELGYEVLFNTEKLKLIGAY